MRTDGVDQTKSYIASQFRVASISYGIFFCLIGVVFNTIEPFKACTVCENTVKIVIELFYIFLYSVSIIWIITMFVLILSAKRQQKVAIRMSTGLNRRLSSEIVTKNPDDAFSIVKQVRNIRKSFSIQKQDPAISEYHDESDALSENIRTETATCNKESNDSDVFHFTYDYENGTGELYMRCGTAIFSVCAMIDRCLSLIQMFEVYVNSPQNLSACRITFTITMVSNILSLTFIFVQSFFIFKYANIVINYGKNMSVIGLIHIVCTNFCVSFRTIVHETVSEIRHHYHKEKITHLKSLILSLNDSEHLTDYDLHKILVKNTTSSLVEMNQIGCIGIKEFHSDIVLYVQEAREKLNSYLYPSIIEYSLMSLTVFFILWESIDLKHNSQHSRRSSLISHRTMFASNPNVQHQKHDANHFTIDCGKSTTGLFVGIFSMLLTIMSLMTYFIYKDHDPLTAIKLSEITELCLILFSMSVVIAIFVKLKSKKFIHNLREELCYNSVLTIMGLAGVYLYGFYSIIAILNNDKSSTIENLKLLIQICSIVESTMQSVLIINALKMYTKDKNTMKSKPGRSLITLLILLDVCLWLSETMSVKKYDMNGVQLKYYDIIMWSIVTSISSPLAIFFRFHASVCLSDIWKTLYEE